MHMGKYLADPRYCREFVYHFFLCLGGCDALDCVTEVFAFHELHEHEAFTVAYMQNPWNVEPFTAEEFTGGAFSLEPRSTHNGERKRSKRPNVQRKPLKPRPVLKPLNKNFLLVTFGAD